MNCEFDVDLWAGDLPYISIFVQGIESYVPFQHTLELYTRNEKHPLWYSDDYDNFSIENRTIQNWEWILVLDGAYKHKTMISSLSESIHGNRFSICSLKNYKRNTNQHVQLSMNADDCKEELFTQVCQMFDKISNDYRQTEHILNGRQYKHVR
jgi:hypothetical protein